VNGTVSDTDDKTVEYTYQANDQMKTLKAYLTSSTSETTEWILGITSPLVSNDILKKMRYPDASTGASSSSEKDQYTYNRLGQVVTFTDRNGNVHTYSYDIVGRITSDAITTLGSGVDGAVRRIETAYDTQGNAYLFTSYNAASGGSIVNQVQREFNGLGQLITEWQATNGVVNTSTSPKVQYAYSFAPSGSTNHSRLTSITYPNGRVVTYNYASGLGSDILRLTSISDGGTTLESYEYLGYGTVVTRGHAQSGVDLTYVKLSGESDGAAGDKYNGLDLFGRIIDHRWTTNTPTTKVRWQYGYDRDSNPLYKENLIDSTRSELYSYDGFNQLLTMDRGTLNGGKTAISGASSRAQAWDYDGLGNWDSLTNNGGSPVTRGHNKQNEITSISGASTPTYDANGNMLSDETGKQFSYDAWNRLVIVKNSGGTTLATYAYDARGYRVRETRSGTTTDLFYSTQWQVLEESVAGTTKISYVWSPVYVDAMIARDRDSDSNGSLDERLYVAHDANFNVIALIDTSGTVVERFAYDAFGVFSVLTPAWGARGSSSYGWNYLHQGGRWDADGGLYSFRHREYSPTLGRWNRIDPIGPTIDGPNLFNSLANSPVKSLDQDGLWTRDGVITFLKQSEAGKKVLSQIADGEKSGKIKVYSADLRYKYTENAKGVADGLPFSDKRMSDWKITYAYGITSYSDGGAQIYLHNELNDFFAAWTLVHEAAHAAHGKPVQPWASEGKQLELFLAERFRIELDAHLAEARMFAENQDWITKGLMCDTFKHYIERTFRFDVAVHEVIFHFMGGIG